MGGDNSTCNKDKVDYSNICNEKIGQEHNSSGFCTISGSEGTKYRREYCAGLSDGEWDYSGQGGNCNYNSCNIRQKMDFCCDTSGCCGIVGNSTKCRRKAFKANELLCCLRDKECNRENKFCFENETEKRTCAPEYRNQASIECKNKMLEYCTGQDVEQGNSSEWINRWTGTVEIKDYNGYTQAFYQPCYKNLYRNLYAGQPSACLGLPDVGINDTAGYNYDQNLMNQMISRYLQDGGNLAANESSESNIKLNNMIYNICSKTPGLCQKSLFNYCANVTPSNLERNPDLLKWCGCYMAPDQYSKYTNLYQISRECTPTCNIKGVIPLVTPDGNSIKECKQSTCIIDDTSINLVNSTVGEISINQLCNSCSQDQTQICNCTITGTNFTAINSKIEGGINISQNCTGKNSCYKEETDPFGKIINVQIPCVGESDISEFEEIQKQNELNKEKAIKKRNITILIIFIVLLLLIAIIWITLVATKVIKTPPSLENT